MVASGVLKIHLVPTKKACYSYIIMDMQQVGITPWLQIIQFQLNAWPPELDGMPRLGRGLAGREDHEADPDWVVLDAETAPREPPPPRSSFMSELLYLITNVCPSV